MSNSQLFVQWPVFEHVLMNVYQKLSQYVEFHGIIFQISDHFSIIVNFDSMISAGNVCWPLIGQFSFFICMIILWLTGSSCKSVFH